ncbi:MAG: hypothetical protein IVW57_04880 [Ktedonobacterales bacterium]|nr:hypothetical protein [Ktedonobacterales bacterium]
MNLLSLKLILTPLLIGAVSLAGRRWGPVIGGLLVGLPLTSGPVALFLALGHGPAFAASAAAGILAGGASGAIFCLAYSRLAFRLAWQPAILVSWALFFAVTWLLQPVTLAPVPLFIGVTALLFIVLRLLPAREEAHGMPPSPWWDIPARMVIATAFVLLLTGVAPTLGPRLSGLLAPFPIYVSILGIFTHRFAGAVAVASLIRGVVVGLFSFVTFFLIVTLLIVPVGIVVTFIAATVVTLAMQGASLWLLHRRARWATPLPDPKFGVTP